MFVFNVAAPGSATVHAPTTEAIPHGHTCWPECRTLNNAKNTRYEQVEAPVNCPRCLAALAGKRHRAEEEERMHNLVALIHPEALAVIAEKADELDRRARGEQAYAATRSELGRHEEARHWVQSSDHWTAVAESLRTLAAMGAALVAAEQARR